MMKKHLPTVALALVFLLGSGLLLYPSVSDYWNSLHQSKAIAGYVQSVATTAKERQEQLLAQAREYNRGIRENGVCFTLSKKALREYRDTLKLDNSDIIGTIEIRSIGCSLPIYHGTDEAVLQVAVGHLAGSSLPVGGEGTHCVLSGHRGLPSAKLFSDLNRLEAGDTFVLQTLGETLTYEVESLQIVSPSDTSALMIEDGADLCTLVTCTPYGINTHRLLVRGRRVPNSAVLSGRVCAEALILKRELAAILFAVPISLILLIGLTVSSEIRKRTNEVRKKIGLK